MRNRTTFGVAFDPITFGDLKSGIMNAVDTGRRISIGYVNLHGAYVYRRTSSFRRFCSVATILYADGFPLVVWRRLLWRDCNSSHRFTLSQHLPDLLQMCVDKGWKVYYVGSRPDVLDAAFSNLRRQIPGLEIHGRDGFFNKDKSTSANAEVLEDIGLYEPQILFIGMGMPTQESWFLDNKESLSVPVIYACGAAIEYFSGFVPRPPSWVSKWGIEWLFRLFSEPRKLYYRYLVEPFSLLPAIVEDIQLRLRR